MADRPLVAIVDDDKSIRNAISDLLKAAGFNALAFEDAESFLRSPDRALVDCLVADMRMPGMSGLHRELDGSVSRIDLPGRFLCHGEISFSLSL